MRRHALLLLACARSGATALAAGLAGMGATLGRTFLRASDGEVPQTFQSKPLRDLNDRLLASLGLRWDSLVPPPERWRERPCVRALVDEADALIRSEFGEAPQIVLHDPRLAITAPFWRERLDAAGIELGAALVVRRPVEVAASIAKRESFAPEKSLALWLHYLGEAERNTRGMPRTLVTYDRLLDAPAGVLAHVLAETRSPLKPDRMAREAALAAIRPDLKHAGEGRVPSTRTLSSGMDAALDEGYARIAQLVPGTDFRRAVEALAQSAYPAMTQAIPPWLAQELAAARTEAERRADALAEAVVEVAALRAKLASQASDVAAREREEAKLRARIDELTQPRGDDGRDARIDEALVRLAGDVGRIAGTISDQPGREQALRTELTQAQRDLEDERATISKLSQALEEERATSENNASRLAVTHAHLQTVADELQQLRAHEASWNAHSTALTQELDETRSLLDRLQLERDTLGKERDHLASELARATSDLESARTDLRIVDHDRNALAARAQAVGDAAGALREELARRAAAEAALVAERDRLAGEVRNHTDRIRQLERDLARRVAELTSVSGRHENATRTLQSLERSWIGRKVLAGSKRRPA